MPRKRIVTKQGTLRVHHLHIYLPQMHNLHLIMRKQPSPLEGHSTECPALFKSAIITRQGENRCCHRLKEIRALRAVWGPGSERRKDRHRKLMESACSLQFGWWDCASVNFLVLTATRWFKMWVLGQVGWRLYRNSTFVNPFVNLKLFPQISNYKNYHLWWVEL